ncbi:hypothetical protein QL996_01765 [Planococcus sp. APC 4015]|nr:hypothetical protein [Planococcus sp. APC 4015]
MTIPEPEGTPSATPQPVQDLDTTIDPQDPAQAEWEQSHGESAPEEDVATATGDDPAQIPADDDDIPADDLPGWSEQPDTQGASPLTAELGEDGQGDLAPEDL